MSRNPRHPLGAALRLALATGSLVTLMGAHCPNSLQPATGDLEVNVLRGVDTAGSLCPITQVHWSIVPVSVPPRPDGSSVGTTPIDKWTQYSGGTGSTSGGTAQFPVVCRHSETFPGLAPGTWGITAKAVRGNAFTCNKVVTAGGTISGTWVFNVGGTAESCN